MKVFYWVLFFTFLAGLNSCMWGVKDKHSPDITKDTLVYTYVILKKSIPCPKMADVACTEVNVRYAFFKSDSLLNDTVTKKLIKLFPNLSGKNLDTLVKNFLSESQSSDQPTSSDSFTLRLSAKIIRQDSSLTTLEINGNMIKGGAHGETRTTFINWNAKANQSLTLSDIFQKHYEDQLTKTGEVIFRKNEKLSSDASLASDYFFKSGKFALTSNFLITPLGIKFLYNEYEIKPYYAGQTELFIRYAQIKSFLKPNTVITQYLK